VKVTDAMRSAVYKEMAKRGGEARRDKLTQDERSAIARKAGKASGVSRRRKAEEAA